MIGVRAFSRLHFGVLSLGTGEGEVPPRHFGGVGLMIQDPGLSLHVAPAPDWSADGPLATRALQFARGFAASVPPESGPPMRLEVERCAPEHVGLGTGTQLGLAVAQALVTAWGLAGLSAAELAARVGRGKRSGLGTHGFALGGFLVDAGKRSPEAVAPVVARADFPEDWRFVLVLPLGRTGLHGPAERRAFEQLKQRAASRTDVLCRLVLLGLLPALAERDAAAFGDALYEFNRLVGETFALVQGGNYAGPRIEEVVSFIRCQGVRGVAQSSWGPAVCALAEDEARAAELARRLRDRFGPNGCQVFATAASNQGAQVLRSR